MKNKKLDVVGMLIIGFVVGIMWIAACGGGGSTIQQVLAQIVYAANQISYDATTTGLTLNGSTVSDVQDAIDALDEAMTGGNISYSNTTSGLTADDVQGAIDEVTSAIYFDTKAVAAVKAADGTSSGFDADLLDGVDSSSFLRNDDNDTSTGTITAGGFTTTGTVTAGEVTLGTPKTGYLSIPGAAFSAATNGRTTGLEYSTSDYAAGPPMVAAQANLKAGEVGIFIAPVYLPHGATITSVTSYVLRNQDDRLDVTFDSYTLSSTAAVSTITTSTFNTTTSASIQSLTATPGSTTTINNSTTAYVLRANFSTDIGSNLWLRGVVIEYTYTDL